MHQSIVKKDFGTHYAYGGDTGKHMVARDLCSLMICNNVQHTTPMVGSIIR